MFDKNLTGCSKRASAVVLGLLSVILIAVPLAHAQTQGPPRSQFVPPKQVPKDAPKLDILQMRSQFANRVSVAVQSSQTPPGFPVPVYSFNATSANFNVSTSPKFQAMSGTIMTKDNPQQAYQWYKSYFSQNGWTIAAPPAKPTPAEQRGELVYISATKDRYTVTIACVRTAKLPETILNISTFGAPPTPATR